jgi:hypothetical protein
MHLARLWSFNDPLAKNAQEKSLDGESFNTQLFVLFGYFSIVYF